MSVPLLGCGRGSGTGTGGPSGGGVATWNPSDKDAGITLSGGNLTTTGSGGARTTASVSTGKAYWEILCNQISGENSVSGPGYTDAATSFATSRSNGIINCVFLPNGNINNGSGATVGAGFANGDTLCVAVDFGAKKSWFRKNGGNWNNSGSNDPTTGVGGVSFGNTGPYFALVNGSDGSTSYTANFGASSFSFTMPSGFTSWNGLI